MDSPENIRLVEKLFEDQGKGDLDSAIAGVQQQCHPGSLPGDDLRRSARWQGGDPASLGAGGPRLSDGASTERSENE